MLISTKKETLGLFIRVFGRKKKGFVMYAMPAFISVHNLHVWCPQRPEIVLDTLKLGLQMVLSLYVGVGNQTQMLWKSIQCS